MKTIGWAILVAAVACGSGCAPPSQDWIERTLVTVDVSGQWEGVSTSPRGISGVAWMRLDLQQKGPKASGTMVGRGFQTAGTSPPVTGLVEGTVAGDLFSFTAANGGVIGELTVSEDEMSGLVSGAAGLKVSVTLRRVKPYSPPRPSERN